MTELETELRNRTAYYTIHLTQNTLFSFALRLVYTNTMTMQHILTILTSGRNSTHNPSSHPISNNLSRRAPFGKKGHFITYIRATKYGTCAHFFGRLWRVCVESMNGRISVFMKNRIVDRRGKRRFSRSAVVVQGGICTLRQKFEAVLYSNSQ